MRANDIQIGGEHYRTGETQHWDWAVALPYLEGCATKYLARWRQKGGIKDLHKARHYLQKRIENPIPLFPSKLSELPFEVDSSRERWAILIIGNWRTIADLRLADQIIVSIIEEEEQHAAGPNVSAEQ